ncbi:MAG: methyltransferase domain-containing protein [Bacteroidales bacterium]
MLKKNNKDIYGQCCLDYLNGDKTAKILVHSNIAETDELPASYLFRPYEEMPFHEKKALRLVRGNILDVGACAGSHALYLQDLGYDVTALDASAGCCEVMQKRGVKNIVCSEILEYSEKTFDTILLLMNGIGISGTLANLPCLLDHLKTLLKTGGKIIFDSSDLQYLYLEEDGSACIPLGDTYYGELEYYLEYKELKTDPFKWVFIDPYTMEAIAKEVNFQMQFIAQGKHYDYSACLY